MDVFDVAAAVAVGNILTLSAYWGVRELMHHESGDTAPWWALGATLFPLLVIAATLLVALK